MTVDQAFQHGLALFQAGRVAEAENVYRAITVQMPHVAEGWLLLGLAIANQDRFAEAAECFQSAIERRPDWADAHESLGSTLTRLGQPGRAIESFEKALSINPTNAQTHANLGAALIELGRFEAAIRACLSAIELDPNSAEAHNNLGNAYLKLHKVDDAIAEYDRAIALNPGLVDAISNLGDAQSVGGRTEEAIATWRRAHALQPGVALQLKIALAVAPIPGSKSQVIADRRRVEKAVEELMKVNVNSLRGPERIDQPNFYSAYRGFNDRDIQMAVARIVLHANPELRFVANPPHRTRDRIRVGFLSRFFYGHTVGMVNAGLIKMLSRQSFEVMLLGLPGPNDEVAGAIRKSADAVVELPNNLPEARKQIADLGLDVLIYADIGMEPTSYLLAFSRLAPVQCVAWGHPVTTGIPSIDYYLSSVGWEPPDADDHYSEKLVRLEHLPVYYSRPQAPATRMSRNELGMPEADHLYICPQSLFKIHPEFDSLIQRILQADPRGTLLLPRGEKGVWTRLLQERFQREIPDVADRIRFLDRVEHDRFLQILANCDVMLDPTPFGGGQTSFDALAMGLPIVVFPGQFMRGRLTYGVYQQMGVDDCIASSPEQYVEIAVRLATDPMHRQAVSHRIIAAHDRLFENISGVRDLEAFLIGAVRSSREIEARTD